MKNPAFVKTHEKYSSTASSSKIRTPPPFQFRISTFRCPYSHYQAAPQGHGRAGALSTYLIHCNTLSLHDHDHTTRAARDNRLKASARTFHPEAPYIHLGSYHGGRKHNARKKNGQQNLDERGRAKSPPSPQKSRNSREIPQHRHQSRQIKKKIGKKRKKKNTPLAKKTHQQEKMILQSGRMLEAVAFSRRRHQRKKLPPCPRACTHPHTRDTEYNRPRAKILTVSERYPYIYIYIYRRALPPTTTTVPLDLKSVTYKRPFTYLSTKPGARGRAAQHHHSDKRHK